MPGALLIYDGDCPFCSRYARYVRLREALGGLELVNARDGGAAVEAVKAQGHDLNQGMVLILGEETYHGDACLHRLALMSSKSDGFNKINALLFRSAFWSRLSYPFLRGCRNLTLALLGREKLR